MRFNFQPVWLASISALVLLASCARDNDEASSSAPAQPPIVEEKEAEYVPATDELGAFQSAVTGISLWAHPSVTFESAVLATNGDAGLYLISFESEILANYPGNFQNGLSVGYANSADRSETIIIAKDSNDENLNFLKVTLDPIELEPWAVTGDELSASNVTATCTQQLDTGTGIRIFAIKGDGSIQMATAQLDQDTDVLVIENASQITDGIISKCAVDDRSGIVYLLGTDGIIDLYDTATGTKEGATVLEAHNFQHIALMMEGETGGYLLGVVADDNQYTMKVFDLLSLDSIGSFTLHEFSEIEAVNTVSAFAADAGNFGGLYRNGVIAVVEGAETYALKLAPWGAVRNAFQFAPATGTNRHKLFDQDTDTESDSPLDFLPTSDPTDG